MVDAADPPSEENSPTPETAAEGAAGVGHEPEKFRPVSTVQSLRTLAQNFARPAARAPIEQAPTTKEIVNGLDRRERLYGLYACIFGAVVGTLSYLDNHRSTNLATRSDAIVYLFAFLIALACMIAGTALRRRALLGFASLLGGLELISSHAVPFGLLYLIFGFWLIYRVTQRQRQQREANGTAPPTRRATGRRTPSKPSGPKASKRYTPPRSRSSSGRRR